MIRERLQLLVDFKDLLSSLTKKEIRVRYKRSILGIFWALGEPLFQMALFTVIFSIVLKIKIEQYPIFVLTGLVVWNFIVSSLRSTVNAVTGNSNLVKKVFFPREVLVISAVTSRLVHFFISLVILFFFFIIFRIRFSLNMLYLPLVTVALMAFVLGLGLIVSSLNVFYTDTSFLLDFFVFLWFYASPIFYSSDMVPASFEKLYMLNPATSFLETYRNILMYGKSPGYFEMTVIVTSALSSIVIGYWLFLKLERRFAEVL